MNTILVWVLVSVSGHGITVYSPPMVDLESCQRLQQTVEKLVWRTQCVQIRVPKYPVG